MARPKKEENNNGNQTDASKNLLNSLLNGYKEDIYNEIQEPPIRFTSGSLLLDSILHLNGSPGLTTGQVVRLGGLYGAGKTSQALLLMANYMAAVPKSKCIFVKAEGRLSEDMQKRSGLKFTLSADDWDYGSVFILETNQFEVMADILEGMLKSMHKNGEKLCCVIDSLDGLILSSDLKEKKIGENTMVAGVPKLTKLFFRRLALPINKYNSFFCLSSQVSQEIKLNPYEKTAPRAMGGSGGSSAAHAADVMIEYQPRYNGDLILENPKEKPSLENKVLGHEVTLKIIKSTNETDSMTCKIPIRRGRVGNAVWVEKEVVDMCLSFQILKKKGAWFSFDTSLIQEAKEKGLELQEQFQGMESVYLYIEANKPIFEWLYGRFKKILTQ